MRALSLSLAGFLLAAPAALAQARVTAVRAPAPGAALRGPPPSCPEGRLADGTCVNPVLARIARTQTICFSQIRLSFIACPGTLPGLDFRYKFPNTVVTERQREIDTLYERQAYQSAFGLLTRTTRPTTTTSIPITTAR